MTSFSTMSEAMFLAVEGQQQIAQALIEALGRSLIAFAKPATR